MHSHTSLRALVVAGNGLPMGLLIAYYVSPYYYYVRAVGLLIQPVQYLYTSSTVDFQLFRLNRYFVPTIVPKNWYTFNELR